MGFWDNNPPEKYQNSEFLSEEEVEQLINDHIVIEITNVTAPTDGKFGKQQQVHVNIEGEERKKSFTLGSVDGRDKMLADMVQHFASNGAEPIKVVFARWGRAVGIEPVLEGA